MIKKLFCITSMCALLLCGGVSYGAWFPTKNVYDYGTKGSNFSINQNKKYASLTLSDPIDITFPADVGNAVKAGLILVTQDSEGGNALTATLTCADGSTSAYTASISEVATEQSLITWVKIGDCYSIVGVEEYPSTGTASSGDFADGGNTATAEMVLGTNNAYGIAFETSGTDRINIDSSGNVGIGVETPGSTLTVNGSVHLNSAGGDNNFRYDSATVTKAFFFDAGQTVIAFNGAGTYDATASGVLAMKNGTAPAAGTANVSYLYARDVTASSELHVMDEAGNETQISPHDPITGEWIFLSRNKHNGREVRIDMERLVKFIDGFFGTKFFQETFVEVKK